MSHGTEHHIEEAEHAQHAAHNPFDKRVALSMAIVAAALASVTLLSHRSHGEVLVKKTEESDQWNYFQAKKNRGYMYAADAELLEALAKDAPESEAGKKEASLAKKWKDGAEKYEADSKKAEETANELKHEGHIAHDSSNFFDLGELGIELALVLCSVAMLAKRKTFWIVGIVVGVLGFTVAMCGFFCEPILAALHQIGVISV
jgi:Domain of unknown function (DUF4337)